MTPVAEAHRRDHRSVFSPSFWLGLLALLIAACTAVNVGRGLPVTALAAITVTAFVATRTPLRRLSRLLPLFSFGLFCFLLLLIVPLDAAMETARLPVWGKAVPLQGMWFLGALMVKSTLIVLLTTAFAERLSERDLLAGLTGLALPAKMVSLCYLMGKGVRSLRDEAMRLVRARDARGRPRGLRAVRIGAAMAQVLMIRLGRRAENQAFALCARGYAGRLAIVQWRHISALEVAALAVCLPALTWLILL